MSKQKTIRRTEKSVGLPDDWAGIGVQLPLFPEHVHTVAVRGIRIVCPERVRVKWVCACGRELEGREFSETFNLSGPKGKERFKAFLSAIRLGLGNGTVDLEDCRGKHIEVMVIARKAGRTERIEIIHYLLR